MIETELKLENKRYMLRILQSEEFMYTKNENIIFNYIRRRKYIVTCLNLKEIEILDHTKFYDCDIFFWQTMGHFTQVHSYFYD